MIFTECTNCNESIIYGYEAGDKPCGNGVYGKVECEICGYPNYVERVSIGGETICEDEAKKLGLNIINKN